MPESSRARQHLIATQRRLVDEARQEIEKTLEPQPPELAAYSAAYQEHASQHCGPVPLDTLYDTLEKARLVYFGDYHTLRESQKAPVRVLGEMRRRGREVVIATEVMHVVHQDHVNEYLAGDLDDKELLLRVDYGRTWGFPWKNYRVQFEFARREGIPVYALNSDPAPSLSGLTFRDGVAALVLTEVCHRHPDALIAVIFGDLHVAPEHLPRRVDEAMAQRGVEGPPRIVVYQNVEEIYWDLADSNLEQQTELVRVDDSAFCLLNSTPLVKTQSYLNWETNQDELEQSPGLDSGPSISSNFMTEQLLGLVQTVGEFLGISTVGLDDFTVHTSRDLDFLDKLAATGEYGPDELEEIRHQVERDESYFIPKKNIIYLGNLSIDHAAEEASHYLNTKLAGHATEIPDRRFDFYYRVLKEAIGFFGSRVSNHKRRCHQREDFVAFRERLRGRRLKGRSQVLRQVSEDVLAHFQYEDDWLSGDRTGYPRLRSIYDRDMEVHIGTTHCLGYVLGDRIYDALMVGRVRRNEIRHFFRQRFTHADRPRETYFDWIDYLG